MNKTLDSAKNFWAAKKHHITTMVAVTAVGTAVMMRVSIKQHDDFLKEHGLYEDFYQLNEE